MNTTSKLRDYQLSMLQDLYKAWKRKRSVMVQMPTGTGKTHLMAAVIEKYADKGVLVVAHRRELIAQISQTLDGFGIEHGLIVSGREIDFGQKVQVASIQTLIRRSGHTEMRRKKGHADITESSLTRISANEHKLSINPTLVIVDEAHHALADTYRMLWDRWPKAKFLGLTATPCRLNGAPFTDLFDTLLQSWSIVDFINKGWLSDMDYVSVRATSKTVKRIAGLDKRSVDGDFQTVQMALVLDTPESIEHLYAAYKEYAGGKKGIVYAVNRDHARHIADYYQEHGVDCAVIDSKTPAEERKRIIEAYKAPSGAVGGTVTLSVLINVNIFSEGFDCPEVEFIQLARPTLSLSLYMQQVCRGMRISKGKSAVTILDQVGSYLLFGLPTTERDWQGMFLGTASGKGSLQKLKKTFRRSTDEDRMLADEQLFRIDALADREKGRQTEKPLRQERAKKDEKAFLRGSSFDPKNPYHCIVRLMARLWDVHKRLLAEVPRHLSKAELVKTLADKDGAWLKENVGEEKCRMLVVVGRNFQQDMLSEALSKNRGFYKYHIFGGVISRGLEASKIVICRDDVLKEHSATLSTVFTPNLIVIWDGNSFAPGRYAPFLSVWAKAKVIGLTAAPCDNWATSKGMLYEALAPYDDTDSAQPRPKRKAVTLVSAPYEGVTQMCMRSLKPRIDARNYVTGELRDLLTMQGNIMHVYRSYEQYAKGRRGIIYTYNSCHASVLQACFLRNGVQAEVLCAETEEAARMMMLDFCKGRIEVLIAVNDYDASYPLPETEFVQMTYPSQRLSAYLNMVESGRKLSSGFRDGERVKNSDNTLVVIDNTLMSDTFGHPAKKRDWRMLFQESLYYDSCGQLRKPPQPDRRPKVAVNTANVIIPVQADKWELRRQRLLGTPYGAVEPLAK